MKIALDYDKTFTLDPAFWTSFINQALGKNHDIRIVTARDEQKSAIPPEHIECPVVYCNGVAKKYYCLWFEDWEPDLWIDDDPQNIYNNATYTPTDVLRWKEESE